MLPIPETKLWSSSARLMLVRRGRTRPASSSTSNTGSSGSQAMCSMGLGTASPPTSTSSARCKPPKVRWSTNRNSGPPSANRNRTRRCFSSGAPGGCTSSCPLIPKCATSASPSGSVPSPSSIHRYLPRRRAAVRQRPTSRVAKSSAPGTCRRTARGCSTSTSATVRPATCSATPRRTTSTSGSSGTDNPHQDTPNRSAGRLGPRGSSPGLHLVGELPPSGLGGLLLGFLLGPPGAAAERLTAHRHVGAELLAVIGALLLHPVLGHAQAGSSGQLLQAGLPVQPGAAQRSLHQQRLEQPVDHLARGLDPVLQVDRAEHGLQPVGEDARLVPTTGQLFTTAEQQVRPETAFTQVAGDAGQRVHVDHTGPQLRQLPLGEIRVVAVQPVGDHQTEHRVTQELQPLLRWQATVLIGVRPVGESKSEKLGVEFDAERLEQRSRVRLARTRAPRVLSPHYSTADQAGWTT